MAWKCSLELTHVYNIYCGNTPSRAPQLHRSIRSHKPLWVLRNTSEGRGSIWVNLLSRRNSVIRNSAASFTFSFFFTTRGIDALLPRQIPHGVISARHIISRILYLSVCLSVCLRFFLSYFRARTPACVNTHTETYVGDTWIFISVSPCPLRGNTFLDHH